MDHVEETIRLCSEYMKKYSYPPDIVETVNDILEIRRTADSAGLAEFTREFWFNVLAKSREEEFDNADADAWRFVQCVRDEALKLR